MQSAGTAYVSWYVLPFLLADPLAARLVLCYMLPASAATRGALGGLHF